MPYTLRESAGQLVKEYLLSETFHEDDGDNQLSDEMSELRTNKTYPEIAMYLADIRKF